ncbi:MAG: hypothetical protein KatS3mg131_3941 [Candidatus Tectimicrobiota bacterium]|nr:MAG: hypothetical protein KatS3mg131_3941 [Candidatus Tectomicrobia bacterium]
MARGLFEGLSLVRPSRLARDLVVLLLVAVSGATAAPLFGVSPRTQFFLGSVVRSFGLFGRSTDSGVTLEAWAAPLVLSYALQTDMTLTLGVPFLVKRLETPAGDRQREGVGDLNLTWKYTFLRRDRPFARDQAALLVGLELPTGALDREAPPLSLGSRSLDGILGAAVGHTTRHFSIEGGLVYKANTEANDFRFGNTLSYDLYLAYQGPIPTSPPRGSPSSTFPWSSTAARRRRTSGREERSRAPAAPSSFSPRGSSISSGRPCSLRPGCSSPSCRTCRRAPSRPTSTSSSGCAGSLPGCSRWKCFAPGRALTGWKQHLRREGGRP